MVELRRDGDLFVLEEILENGDKKRLDSSASYSIIMTAYYIYNEICDSNGGGIPLATLNEWQEVDNYPYLKARRLEALDKTETGGHMIDIEDIPADVLADIRAAEKQYNDDFMNGQSSMPSNVVTKEKTNSLTIDDISLRGFANGIGDTLTASGLTTSLAGLGTATSKALTDMSPIVDRLEGMTVNLTKNAVLSYLTERLTGLATIDFTAVTGESVRLIKDKLRSTGAIVMDLTLGEEARRKMREEANNALQQSAAITKMLGWLAKVKTDVQDMLNSAVDDINKITRQVENGDEWIVNNLNMYYSKFIKNTYTLIGNTADRIEKFKRDTIYSMAENLAVQEAQRINESLERIQKKALDMVERLKQMAITLVKTLAQTAIMMLIGLLGIAA